MSRSRKVPVRSIPTTLTDCELRSVGQSNPCSYFLIGCVCVLGILATAHSPCVLADPFPASLSPSSRTITTTTRNGQSQSPIHDATCNMEDLEKANDSQLYEILNEIKQTQFFRNFVVDLEHKCPLDSDSEKEEVYECSGGAATSDDHELDDHAEPLCSVDVGSPINPFTLDSNALHTLKTSGFQSKAQKDTFAWQDPTDQIFTEKADPTSIISEDALLPDTFWKDMCSSIGLGDSTKTVNLALNPERNTGYNGTHIWKAIYEENCIAIDGQYDSMCFEERVLYRLLSGLHTQTTVSIAKHYYPPSKRKNRTDWEPNPVYFMEKFEENPDHIRNLHFSYVVLLRALRKATPFLYDYHAFKTGNLHEDEIARKLTQRLLDSSILQSCSNVFSAFDESLMFQEDVKPIDNITSIDNKLNITMLQQNFKGVFHNVSSILDCVQCQQCKLHGKLAMTGYGAALKVLFMSKPALDANEIVALLNTVAKMSESIRDVRELTQLYWEQTFQQQKTQTANRATPAGPPKVGVVQSTFSSPTDIISPSLSPVVDSVHLVDSAVGLVAALGRASQISLERESQLVQMALQRNPEILILAKHYGTDAQRFLQFLNGIGSPTSSSIPESFDAIVVGSGLAGMAATLNLLDRGGRVVMMEKEHLLGGNSNKASSGINACCPSDTYNSTHSDTLELFYNDTLRSAGDAARPDLISTLVSRSAAAVTWLQKRVGVDLSLIAQLGGHSSKRTHRPSNGMAGAEIIYGIQRAVKEYTKSGQVVLMTDTRVTKLLTDVNGAVTGVEYLILNEENSTVAVQLHAPNVVLATGGFAADRSTGSFLDKYRPELLKMPTTAGAFSTGDGISLATQLGARTIDMDKVQVHPTGWVDPKDPDNRSKVLAAELMRGVGGILLNHKGERFCNELGTRAYVTHKMLQHDPTYNITGNWSLNATVPTFSLVLSSSAAMDGKKHVDLYTHKGLMTRMEGVVALSEWMGISKETVIYTLQKYLENAAMGEDDFGKSDFRGIPSEDIENEIFYVGTVTPVLHYCMGGIAIDAEGSVLNENGEIIPGLHAAGEVSGGVHGVNRLGGNSLLECTVYGTIVGQKLPIQQRLVASQVDTFNHVRISASSVERRMIVESELQKHNTPDDCWVAIHGTVYDLTEFAAEHPAGPDSIIELAGQDGTEAFEAVHNSRLLEEFDQEIMGIYKAES